MGPVGLWWRRVSAYRYRFRPGDGVGRRRGGFHTDPGESAQAVDPVSGHLEYRAEVACCRRDRADRVQRIVLGGEARHVFPMAIRCERRRDRRAEAGDGAQIVVAVRFPCLGVHAHVGDRLSRPAQRYDDDGRNRGGDNQGFAGAGDDLDSGAGKRDDRFLVRVGGEDHILLVTFAIDPDDGEPIVSQEASQDARKLLEHCAQVICRGG